MKPEGAPQGPTSRTPGIGFPGEVFWAGLAGMSAGAMVGRTPAASSAAATTADGGATPHGVPLRGMYLTTTDRLAEGRFGSMFKKLPAYAPP